MTEAVQVEVRDRVAVLTLSRPDSGNAIDQEMADSLLKATLHIASDDAVRAVLLTGQGRAFCVGGDVKAFAATGTGASALVDGLTASLHVAVARLARMDKPLVTAINGAAAGAGFGLAILGDVALAARSAKFAMAYGAIGLTPDGGATWLLPRLVGFRQAQRLALTGERIDATEAERIGLITRVIDDDALQAEALAVATTLAQGPRLAFARTRALLHQSLSNGLETQLEREARGIAEAIAGPEGQEGIAAFVARRPADFSGL
ncbi:enoyl-CoA hydratase/isomerase family protein [Brevundimonas subvibrioides]|uniref:Enoyl-CoA hydratase/isomerase n=1 Tax=Brevundimonas subvibrioides (strain ATCC 15264 / DSM 4735 / LMG 14903 / NBRC 16000 / CB 81) TaxID=633149 RepID=D9QIJ9_BRESC|nr:enoyl-CoA hydratase-related protein [Brevundimonas subvibrioides]ADL01332.1 Enoyl-CoA hydratase/isomerase [Brevundimonas subvibrioides ATCC 15264]